LGRSAVTPGRPARPNGPAVTQQDITEKWLTVPAAIGDVDVRIATPVGTTNGQRP
jgi:hypothetical protein